MNDAGAKNKFIRHYNGHMNLEFSCKLNFEGENKITMHCTIDLQKFKCLLYQTHADLL